MMRSKQSYNDTIANLEAVIALLELDIQDMSEGRFPLKDVSGSGKTSDITKPTIFHDQMTIDSLKDLITSLKLRRDQTPEAD